MKKHLCLFSSLTISACFVLSSIPFLSVAVQAQESSTETAKPPTQLQLMQKLEDTWSTALAKRDQFGLENVMAPQFVSISATGEVRTRNQDIVHAISAEPGLISVEQKVISVRTFGDVAVVNGTYILTRKQNGQPVEEKGIFTHVFAQSRSKWQCINAQRTIVIEGPLQKGKNSTTASAKSNAQLPFHVPLFHKGAESNATAPSAQQPNNPSPQ